MSTSARVVLSHAQAFISTPYFQFLFFTLTRVWQFCGQVVAFEKDKGKYQLLKLEIVRGLKSGLQFYDVTIFGHSKYESKRLANSSLVGQLLICHRDSLVYAIINIKIVH
jgi:hypothetical protein